MPHGNTLRVRVGAQHLPLAGSDADYTDRTYHQKTLCSVYSHISDHVPDTEFRSEFHSAAQRLPPLSLGRHVDNVSRGQISGGAAASYAQLRLPKHYTAGCSRCRGRQSCGASNEILVLGSRLQLAVLPTSDPPHPLSSAPGIHQLAPRLRPMKRHLSALLRLKLSMQC